eukprot:8380999-Alexandrium_andersonii.AAC.1
MPRSVHGTEHNAHVGLRSARKPILLAMRSDLRGSPLRPAPPLLFGVVGREARQGPKGLPVLHGRAQRGERARKQGSVIQEKDVEGSSAM